MKEEDKDIRDVFESLSRETKAQAPSFETVWNEALNSKQRKIRRLRGLQIAASLLFLVALGTAFLFQKSGKSDLPNHTSFALLEWKAPSDVLLGKANSSTINKIFSQPSDQLLEWFVDENELLK